MATGTLISVDEYLSTSYDPDMEYVDGVLVERNVGEWLHSLIQSNIIFALRRKYPGIYVVPELRSKVTQSRYRLPDVSVLLARPKSAALHEPAFVAVEILSEEDRMSRLMEKLHEYAANGTPNIWVIDPRLKGIFLYEDKTLREVQDELVTEDPRFELTREEIFQE